MFVYQLKFNFSQDVNAAIKRFRDSLSVEERKVFNEITRLILSTFDDQETYSEYENIRKLNVGHGRCYRGGDVLIFKDAFFPDVLLVNAKDFKYVLGFSITVSNNDVKIGWCLYILSSEVDLNIIAS